MDNVVCTLLEIYDWNFLKLYDNLLCVLGILVRKLNDWDSYFTKVKWKQVLLFTRELVHLLNLAINFIVI